MEASTEIQSIIREEGYSANAAKVYLALVQLGSASLFRVAGRAGLHPQSVKNAVAELQRSGLVQRIDHKVSRSLYRAAPPFLLARRLRERQERFTRILATLQRWYRQKTSRFLQVHEGNDAFGRLFLEFWQSAPRGAIIDVLTHPGPKLISAIGISYERAEEFRRSHDIRKRVLVSKSVGKMLQRRPDMTQELLSEYRVHMQVGGPLMHCVSRDRVLLHFFDTSEPTTISVEGAPYAEQIHELFQHLWQEAKGV